MAMAKKSFAPVPKNIESLFQALIDRIKVEGWDKRYNIDLKTIEAKLASYCSDLTKDVALNQSYLLHHKGIAQDRVLLYQLYMDVLAVLRAGNRSQPDMLRSLDVFKRKISSRRKKDTAPSPEHAAAPLAS
jgi:hypothetical protein